MALIYSLFGGQKLKQIKGPGIFLAQFASDDGPISNFSSACEWASDFGYKGIQVPTWDTRLIDLKLASTSQDYCDELSGIAGEQGLVITELSSHLQGQLVAVHPAYNEMFDSFTPKNVRGNSMARQEWAVNQLKMSAMASRNLGLKAHATFSGALLWPTVYPWPQRPIGLVDDGFSEMGKRWKPILNVFCEQGVDLCYELHPGEDLHDGLSFERFLEAVDNHERANILYDPSHFLIQQLDYIAFIDIYHARIKAFHVKDAEFNKTGRAGVYGGYANWLDRPGRFRSLGDGQIDFKAIFSKLTQYGYDGWAVLEWECCLKHPMKGAEEGAKFINQHLILPTERSFDDFAAVQHDSKLNAKLLGLGE